MIENIKSINNKKILFLHGPMSFFYKKLSKLINKNNEIFQICFNKGDEFFSINKNYISFKKNPESWEKFFQEFIKFHNIDIIFLFGDCRFYHKIAIQNSSNKKLKIFVFEEGYVRPNYITCEVGGVNGFSKLPKDKEFYNNLDLIYYKSIGKSDLYFGNTFFYMAVNSSIYYVISSIFKFQYPYYKHHRNFSVKEEFKIGILNFFTLFKYKFKDRNVKKRIETVLSKKYYLVPLQTKNDFQVSIHSKFKSINQFISEVLISFKNNSPSKTFIIFKHHPLDRGRIDYTKFIKKLAIKYNIKDRVIVLHDVKLPLLLKNAIGTVVINSTTGFSSLYHGTPVICMGNALYDIDGLTAYNSKIDNFWNLDLRVDKNLFYKFRGYIIKNTQINTNFYI